MYIELEEKLYKRILEIGSSDYGNTLQKDDKVYVNLDGIYAMLQDLVDEYDNKEEKYNDLKEDMNELWNILIKAL